MYIRRNEDGNIISYTRRESDLHHEWMEPDDQEMLEYLNPPETYIDLRKKAYPSTIEQLEILYDKGVVGWKAEIKKIKEKYPKPDEVVE